jgi:hypothetical protein
MPGRNNRGRALGLSHGDEQYDVFGISTGHEAQVLAEVAQLTAIGVLRPESTERGARAKRSMFGTPAWYGDWCEAFSRAVARDQVTELESAAELERQHALMLIEMKVNSLWRRPRRGGRRRRRRVSLRWRGWTCLDCDGEVGAFTGLCPSCHFAGWWPLGVLGTSAVEDEALGASENELELACQSPDDTEPHDDAGEDRQEGERP